MLTVKHKQLEAMVKEHYRCNKIPIYIWGAPGIGKSDTVRKVAQGIAVDEGRIYVEWNQLTMEEKQDVIMNPQKYFFLKDERLSMSDPSDIKGIPDVRKTNMDDKVGNVKVVEWMVPLWVYLSSLKGIKGIIFFDEMNLAPQSVQTSSYQIINDRACGEISLSDGVMCIAAGNRIEDQTGVVDILKALRNRFTHVTLQPPGISDKCENDWGEWALSHEVDFRIVSFLIQHPSHLNPKENMETDEMAFPTPRSWGKLCSPLIKGKENVELMEMFTAEAVGEFIAKEFASFLRLQEKVNLQEILNNPEKAKEIERIDLKWSLITLIAEWYFANKDSKERKKKEMEFPIDKVLEISEHITPDFAVTMLRLIRGRNQEDFVEQLKSCKRFDFFCKKYKKYFLSIAELSKNE